MRPRPKQEGWFGVISHYLPGDIDGNGAVDAVDLKVLTSQWLQGSDAPSADIAPIDGDDFVDLRDLSMLAKDWRAGAAVVATTPRPPGSRDQ